MTTCWRCGVDFDPSDYIKTAPCPDCQLDFPESWLRIDIAKTREEQRTADWVQYWYGKRYSDGEIGEAIGLTHKQVQLWRKRLGLPAIFSQKDGADKWRDPEKVRADLSKRATGNTMRKGKKATRAGVKAENGRAYSGE